MSHRTPVNLLSRHDRTFNAYSAKVDRAVFLMDRDYTTEAGTKAARHMIFERDFAGDVMSSGHFRKSRQHRRRPAADNLCRPFTACKASFQQFSDETVVASRPVVGCQLDLDASIAEIFNPCQKRSGANSVKQSYVRRGDCEMRLITAFGPEPRTTQGQEWRLTNAAGDEDDGASGRRSETVSKGTPHGKLFTWAPECQSRGATPDDQVDDVEGRWHAR